MERQREDRRGEVEQIGGERRKENEEREERRREGGTDVEEIGEIIFCQALRPISLAVDASCS